MTSSHFKSLLILAVLVAGLVGPRASFAQVESPDPKRLFETDSDKLEDKKKAEIEKILKPDKAKSDDVSFKAPAVEYLQEKKELHGTGGVLISTPDFQVQADSAQMNTETNQATLQGGVLVSGADAAISSEQAEINIETETGTFKSADFELEQGAYQVFSDDLHKLSEKQYSLYGSSLTTCRCSDGDRPWSINTARANVTQEGYAHTYNTWVDFQGVPIFYTPYLGFPVKQERTSGLLVPEWGYGSEDGVAFKQPVFIVVDDSTDLTLTPFIQTETRVGSALDVRKSFSRLSSFRTRLYFSDESARDGDLRGTDVSGMDDPEFDEQRVGGFFSQVWQNDRESVVPLTMVSDIHYVGDDLFAREIEDDDVLEQTDKFATSLMSFRGVIGGMATAEISGEYSQAILDDDDLIFQRLPEAEFSVSKSVRPFGFNPYGLKVVAGLKEQSTNFSRKEGFDGWRHNLNPTVKVPFHYKNYFSSEIEVGANQTEYNMNEVIDPDGGADLDDSNSRSIYNFGYNMSTAVERIYDLPEENSLTYLTSIGASNQDNRLRRVRHTIEPTVGYKYVPDRDQDDLPLYDGFDRLKEKSVFTYGVVSRLYGRFNPIHRGETAIAELTPRLEDVPSLTGLTPLDDFGSSGVGYQVGDPKIRTGEIREIANFSLQQSYDLVERREDKDPDTEPASDLGVGAGLFPTRNFGLRMDTNVNAQTSEVSSWRVSTKFSDDRGDTLIASYRFTDPDISQVEGNLEIKMTEQVRLGYYGRFDEEENDFLENRGALRFISACNCWMIDLGYEEELNPDRKKVMLRMTLKGLGDLVQGVGYGQQD